MRLVGFIIRNFYDVEFYSINKFEKLVHLVGFIIRISLLLLLLLRMYLFIYFES